MGILNRGTSFAFLIAFVEDLRPMVDGIAHRVKLSVLFFFQGVLGEMQSFSLKPLGGSMPQKVARARLRLPYPASTANVGSR